MESIHALQSFASPTLDALMLQITQLGSERAYIVLLVVTYLALDATIGQRLALALLSSFYLNFQLKGLFDTPRPYLLEPEVLRSEAAGLTGPGAGFPSGHAQSSTTFWGLAAVYARRSWFWVVALLVIALVSLSRMYLGVHLPVDVLGGLVIGVLVVVVAYLVFRALPKRGRLPLGLALGLGLLVPLALHLLLPTPDSELLLGGMAAFVTGPRLLPHEAPEGWGRRVALALFGVALVFGFLIGSSILLSEEVKDHPLGGFLRYLLLGYVGVLLVPWLARRLGLAKREATA